jgi:hypothetical protein
MYTHETVHRHRSISLNATDRCARLLVRFLKCAARLRLRDERQAHARALVRSCSYAIRAYAQARLRFKEGDRVVCRCDKWETGKKRLENADFVLTPLNAQCSAEYDQSL